MWQIANDKLTKKMDAQETKRYSVVGCADQLFNFVQVKSPVFKCYRKIIMINIKNPPLHKLEYSTLMH